jgi:hypothetical protein
MTDEADFGSSLASDVTYIYREGFHPRIGASSIPVLAELAEASSRLPYDGADDYYRQAVEALFRRAISRLPTEVRAGVISLLGIDHQEALGVGVRLDEAAEPLGFKSGDSLRHSNRRGGYVQALLADVVDELISLASDIGFSDTGRFAPPSPSPTVADIATDLPTVVVPPPVPVAPIKLASVDDPDIRRLFDTIVDELRTACEKGVAHALGANQLPKLSLLAVATMLSDDTTLLQRTESLLLWGIYEFEADGLRLEGMIELFDLGPVRGQSFAEQRRHNAHDRLRQKPAGEHRRIYDAAIEEDFIFRALARLFTTTAVQHGIDA